MRAMPAAARSTAVDRAAAGVARILRVAA